VDYSETEEDEEDTRPSGKFLSGTEGIWTFVFIDMVVFALIFLTFSSQRVSEYRDYVAGSAQLSVPFGFFNTVILLTSSMFMVRAVEAARLGDRVRAAKEIKRTLLLGAMFCLDKIIEYYHELSSGISITDNSFFTFYFFITFIHFLHVLAGMSFIVINRRPRASGDTYHAYVTRLENVGLFWHFVDLLWVFIYALLYLL
jgi:nitric oxide reductase NorE protein